jgi:outer membrane protein
MRRSILAAGAVVLGLVASATRADAQEAPAGNAEVPELTPSSTKPMPVPEELLRSHPGGLTADQVGQRAMDTSFAAKQAIENMRAANARVDAAWAGFLPRLSAVGKYTRLSPITPASLGNVIGTDVPSGSYSTPGTTQQPNSPPPPPQLPPGYHLISTSLSFPLPVDNTVLQATLTIPLSDYLFRTNQTYTAATHSSDAARFDLGSARANALSNGKIAYYTWLQTRGAVIVAVETLNDQRIHLNDSRNQFTVGNASKADVLRAETAVAQAELGVVQAENAEELAETQMRVALHLPPTRERLVPAEGLDTQLPPFQGNEQALVEEGRANRYEIKSALANALSARRTAEANKAGRYPVVSAFGDAIEANPNPRIFPQTNVWTPSWDVGIQATWSPNDILTANGTGADYDARASALEAQAQVTRENIEIEVTQDFEQLKQADFALDSTHRELASATEAYRVARELFNNGRGTSTTLTDAERDLFTARIDALTAAVNARIARVRLEHAVGRDLARATAAK